MKKTKRVSKNEQVYCRSGNGVCGGGIYGLGFIGSVVYYISTATSFGAGVVGVLKSIV